MHFAVATLRQVDSAHESHSLAPNLLVRHREDIKRIVTAIEKGNFGHADYGAASEKQMKQMAMRAAVDLLHGRPRRPPGSSRGNKRRGGRLLQQHEQHKKLKWEEERHRQERNMDGIEDTSYYTGSERSELEGEIESESERFSETESEQSRGVLGHATGQDMDDDNEQWHQEQQQDSRPSSQMGSDRSDLEWQDAHQYQIAYASSTDEDDMAPTAEEIEILRQHRLNMQVLEDFQAREREDSAARAERERRAIEAAEAEAEARREVLAEQEEGREDTGERGGESEGDVVGHGEGTSKGLDNEDSGTGTTAAEKRTYRSAGEEVEEGGWAWPEDGTGDTGLLSSQSQAGMAARGASPVTPRRTEKLHEEELKDAKLRQQQEQMLSLGRELAAEVAQGAGVDE